MCTLPRLCFALWACIVRCDCVSAATAVTAFDGQAPLEEMRWGVSSHSSVCVCVFYLTISVCIRLLVHVLVRVLVCVCVTHVREHSVALQLICVSTLIVMPPFSALHSRSIHSF